jgi:hypothetical protein
MGLDSHTKRTDEVRKKKGYTFKGKKMVISDSKKSASVRVIDLWVEFECVSDPGAEVRRISDQGLLKLSLLDDLAVFRNQAVLVQEVGHRTRGSGAKTVV